jgi:hypothetical protein
VILQNGGVGKIFPELKYHIFGPVCIRKSGIPAQDWRYKIRCKLRSGKFCEGILKK